jgi:hypothetical protein
MAKRRVRRHRSHSKRGGGSAPQKCRTNLSKCMTGTVRQGGSLKVAGRLCMKAFNRCRT